VGPDGNFSMTLTVQKPPTPCPCVVWVTDSASTDEARVPISVAGVPAAPVRQRTPVLDLSQSVKVSSKITGGSWTTLFGAGSTRTLELTVKNTGTMAIPDPRVNVTFGKGGSPTGFVAPPSIGIIPAGATKTYSVPVSVDTFSLGKYTLKGELAGFGKSVPFKTSISVYPWGLLLLAIALLQLGLLYLRDRRDRTVEDLAVDDAADLGAVAAPVAAAAVAVDSSEPSEWHRATRWTQGVALTAVAATRGWMRRIQAPKAAPAPAPPVNESSEPSAPPDQPALVAAAAAWGTGVRNYGKAEAVAPPEVIDLRADPPTADNGGGLESLGMLTEVDSLTYWVTELYSGTLPAKSGGNGKSNNGTNGKAKNGAARKSTSATTRKPRTAAKPRAAAKR